MNPRAWLPLVWWEYALGAAAVGLFSVGLVERLRCGGAGCAPRLLSLDAVGSLPRLFTTSLFVVVAALAVVGSARAAGLARRWWAYVAGLGLVLAVAKLLSAHSVAKADTYWGTFLLGVGAAGLALALLWRLARRWDVPAGTPIVLALALYAATALGLDLVTTVVEAVQTHVGAFSEAAATFVEELGEALAALVLLVTVRSQLPSRP